MAEAQTDKPKANVKETLTSIIISLAIAFTFRGFVIEGFVIPTGSMAPTLHGAYMRMQSPATGYDWAVGPWDYAENRGQQLPLNPQGQSELVAVTDPMSGLTVGRDEAMGTRMGRNVRLLGGDRIFVLKYLFGLFEPQRFDCVVFRFPGNPRENYIKRLLALPGEELALVDGDIFVRPASDLEGSVSDWAAGGWQIVRKDERTQRQLWMPLFDSRYAPPNIEESRTGFRSPWLGQTPQGERDRDWTIGNARSYTYDGSRPTTLAWDAEARPISDFYPYNDIRISQREGWGQYGTSRQRGQSRLYPVSDIRVSFNIEPQAEGVSAAMALAAREHLFRLEIDDSAVRLRMRAADSESWTDLTSESLSSPLPAGETTRVEFWHADQALSVWIDGERVAQAAYDWTPLERIDRATTIEPTTLVSETMPRANVLTDSDKTIRAQATLEFEGGPFTLHRVRLDRDIHYQAGTFGANARGQRHSQSQQPSRGTHPMQPVALGDGEYFMCGDNSAASLDSRLWDTPSRWLDVNLGDVPAGIVPEELIVGRAFFVYFPALNRDRGFPLPDTGRMRWIW